MNRSILLACFPMLFATTPAMAVDDNSCVSRSAQLNPTEREAFLKSCQEQPGSQTNIEEAGQKSKKALCEQKAQNLNLRGDDLTNYVTTCMTSNEAEAALQPLRPIPQREGSINVGLGLGFADVPENLAIGWDVLAGYEWAASPNWNLGAQVHVIDGSILSDTNISIAALYATARPENRWLKWLQFKAGLVSADYSTKTLTHTILPGPLPYYTNTWQTTTWGGTGGAVGLGLVYGDGKWRFHILDVERYFVAGHSFNVYSISIVVLGQLH